MANGSTRTHQAILLLLSDGLPHTRHEIHAKCIEDELSGLRNIQMHISRIRKHLRPRGEDIICEIVHRRICYRHVRLLVSRHE